MKGQMDRWILGYFSVSYTILAPYALIARPVLRDAWVRLLLCHPRKLYEKQLLLPQATSPPFPFPIPKCLFYYYSNQSFSQDVWNIFFLFHLHVLRTGFFFSSLCLIVNFLQTLFRSKNTCYKFMSKYCCSLILKKKYN